MPRSVGSITWATARSLSLNPLRQFLRLRRYHMVDRRCFSTGNVGSRVVQQDRCGLYASNIMWVDCIEISAAPGQRSGH